MTSARHRRRKQARASAPRVIGANDNIAVSIDDRDSVAKRIARERREAAKADAEAQAARLRGQGVDVTVHPGNLVRAKRVGGLEWLLRKERIGLILYRAGEQYGDDFAKADEPHVRSCLNDSVGGEPEAMQESKVAANERLAGARMWALAGHRGLIEIMDAVAGRGARVRALANGDDAETIKKEALLIVGLELLAVHYGMVKP